MERYFIVFYLGMYPTSSITGNICFATENGLFINHRACVNQIKALDAALVSVVLTNVIEVTKSDHDAWNENS